MNTLVAEGLGLKFDWYQATLLNHPENPASDEWANLLAKDLGTSVEWAPGLNGYENQAILRRDGDVKARVTWGGRNVRPNAWSSGDSSPEFARLMRAKYPHSVSRCDIAYDVNGPCAFERMAKRCLAVADERGVSVEHAGDWHRKEKGRTLYFGSRKSEVRARLYEKGLEQRNKAPNEQAASEIPKDWTRLELVIRPHKKQKKTYAASVAPEKFFGWSIWSQLLVERVIDLDIPRIDRMSWVRTDDQEALAWLVRQYGAVLTREKARLGSWELLGRVLGREIERGEYERI